MFFGSFSCFSFPVFPFVVVHVSLMFLAIPSLPCPDPSFHVPVRPSSVRYFASLLPCLLASLPPSVLVSSRTRFLASHAFPCTPVACLLPCCPYLTIVLSRFLSCASYHVRFVSLSWLPFFPGFLLVILNSNLMFVCLSSLHLSYVFFSCCFPFSCFCCSLFDFSIIIELRFPISLLVFLALFLSVPVL